MSYIQSVDHGNEYYKFRPSPPQAMIDSIVDFLKEDLGEPPFPLAFDVGCGSGQCTTKLSPFFTSVIGVDSDPVQIENATRHNTKPNVSYTLGSADGLPEIPASLVLAVQCAHWFDIDAFYNQVDQILLPNGVLAIGGYTFPTLYHLVTMTDLSSFVLKFFEKDLKDYMPYPSRVVYLEKYKNKEFQSYPFAKTVHRQEFIGDKVSGTLADVIGYIKTTSTYQQYLKAQGEASAKTIIDNLVQEMASQLDASKDPHEIQVEFSFNFFLLLGKKL